MNINDSNYDKNEFLKVFQSENTLEYMGRIEEKRFFLIDTGISPRVFNNWKKLGLIPQEDTVRKWNKFSFTEFIWLKIIQELREFGLSIEKILKVRQVLFEVNVMEGVPKRIEESMEKGTVNLLADIINNANYTEEQKDELRKVSESPELLKEMEKVMPSISLLFIMILNSVVMRRNNGIVIYSSGECMPWFDEFYIINKDLSKVLEAPHIFISLSTFLFDFLFNDKKGTYISSLKILSKEEQEILDLLKTKNLKEITIKFNNKSKPFMLECTSGKEVSKTEAESILKNMVFKNYQSITFKTNNNKTVYIENVEKRQL